jgi:hypothetical protein
MKKQMLVSLVMLAGSSTMFSQDNLNTTLMGIFDTGGSALSVAVSGNYAYVADSSDGLRIVDISSPSHPMEVGFLESDRFAEDVAVSGSYVYVAGDSGMLIIDVSTPSDPIEVGFIKTGDKARDVAVNDSCVFVVGNTGLHIIDVSTSSNPIEAGFLGPYTGHDQGISVSGSYAYIAYGSSGFQIVDISTPSEPAPVGHFNTGGGIWNDCRSVTVGGNYAYLADFLVGGLFIVDVSTPSDPVQIGRFSGYGFVDVTVSDSYVYVTNSGSGLHIIDVSTPSSPAQVGTFNTSGSAQGVDVYGCYVYIADGSGGLCIIRNDLLLSTEHESPSLPQSLSLHQNYPNPFNPVTTIRYDLPQLSKVSLIVFDILGREVVRLVDGYEEPGYHQAQWNGREVPSGTYIGRLVTPGYSKSIKMVLLK